MTSLFELKEKLVTACHILDKKGIVDEHGHFSVRCPEKGGVLMNGKVSPGQARIANDGMAELIQKYPNYFVAGVAALPLDNLDNSLLEIDRALNELNFRGILMHSSINGKPLDSPEFFPIYEKMAGRNLPIFIHPWRTIDQADYQGEEESRYKIWSTFGWPYETSAAITRLIFGGVFDRFPTLKVITHHAGGMIPFFAERIRSGYDLWEARTNLNPLKNLSRAPLDYYRNIYADTAIAGCTPALMCSQAFFGTENLLFGTDMPMDSQLGYRLVRDIIEAIQQMNLPRLDEQKIFADNVRSLLRLPI